MDALTERMYDLAYRFKETELWNSLTDTQLFAVRHEDGSVSYCSVLGMLGQEFALNVYPGPDGFASYLRMLEAGEHMQADPDDPFLIGEVRTAQKCLSCSFEDRDFLSDDEAEEVQAYAKAHRKKLRGSKAYALFLSFEPAEHPWKIESDLDREHLCDALEAALSLSAMLRASSMFSLLIEPVTHAKHALLLSRNGTSWKLGDIAFPRKRFVYPAPKFRGTSKLNQIRDMEKKEIWQCGTFFLPEGIGDPEKNERPWYPLILLAVTEKPALVRPVHMGKHTDAYAFLQALADHILDTRSCPKIIRYADERCMHLLDDFCQKAGIRLEGKGSLKEYKEAELELFTSMENQDFGSEIGIESEEEAEEMMQAIYTHLESMSEDELRRMPEEVLRAIRAMPGLKQHMPEVYKKLKNL